MKALEIITKKKLNQMKFAAKLFVHCHDLGDVNLCLVAIYTANTPPEVIEFVEI